MTYGAILTFKNKAIKKTLKVKLELRLEGSYTSPDKTITIKEVFSAIGRLYDNVPEMYGNRHMICAGQCSDVIPNFVEALEGEDRDKLNAIYELWKKYHLNDSYADCEHDINSKVAGEKITLYTYSFKGGDFSRLENNLKLIENNSLLSSNIKVPNCLKVIQNEYRWQFTSEFPLSHFPRKIRKLYKLFRTETKTRGWVRYNEKLTPSGVLCKPCPVCGYKYGTAWNYRPIPDNDLERIYKLMNLTKSEVDKATQDLRTSLEKDMKASNK